MDKRAPQIYEAGEALPGPFAGRTMSFHDARALIVDPAAVVAIFDDLITNFAALDVSSGSVALTGAGGVRTIAGPAGDIMVHVVDLHGRAFAAVPGGPGVARRTAKGRSPAPRMPAVL